MYVVVTASSLEESRAGGDNMSWGVTDYRTKEIGHPRYFASSSSNKLSQWWKAVHNGGRLSNPATLHTGCPNAFNLIVINSVLYIPLLKWREQLDGFHTNRMHDENGEIDGIESLTYRTGTYEKLHVRSLLRSGVQRSNVQEGIIYRLAAQSVA